MTENLNWWQSVDPIKRLAKIVSERDPRLFGEKPEPRGTVFVRVFNFPNRCSGVKMEVTMKKIGHRSALVGFR